MERLFGLIGFPLGHSFSKKYFTEKFEQMQLPHHRYELFEMQHVQDIADLLKEQPTLVGLNVTIPHKQAVMPFLHALDPSAAEVGAVNVIRVREGQLTGFNSDFFGFYTSLAQWLGPARPPALILGNGGAAKAVMAGLRHLGISYQVVSRTPLQGGLTYNELMTQPNLVAHNPLIINTTPVGMYPHTEDMPVLPYEAIGPSHFLYDLVYNPAITTFMQQGLDRGAQVKNGLEMLKLQAEKAWEIWNT
jgi:shikimate dehydrogenase